MIPRVSSCYKLNHPTGSKILSKGYPTHSRLLKLMNFSGMNCVSRNNNIASIEVETSEVV